MRSHSKLFYHVMLFYGLAVLATVVVPIAFEADGTHLAASGDEQVIPAAGMLKPVDKYNADISRSVKPVEQHDTPKQIEKDA